MQALTSRFDTDISVEAAAGFKYMYNSLAAIASGKFSFTMSRAEFVFCSPLEIVFPFCRKAYVISEVPDTVKYRDVTSGVVADVIRRFNTKVSVSDCIGAEKGTVDLRRAFAARSVSMLDMMVNTLLSVSLSTILMGHLSVKTQSNQPKCN